MPHKLRMAIPNHDVSTVAYLGWKGLKNGELLRAALDAGATRIRPVMMTAGAMILGMIPMGLGVGEGGEQNAPLARAVIGGLLFATFATLILVPTVYRLLRRPLRTETSTDRFAIEQASSIQ